MYFRFKIFSFFYCKHLTVQTFLLVQCSLCVINFVMLSFRFDPCILKFPCDFFLRAICGVRVSCLMSTCEKVSFFLVFILLLLGKILLCYQSLKMVNFGLTWSLIENGFCVLEIHVFSAFFGPCDLYMPVQYLLHFS